MATFQFTKAAEKKIAIELRKVARVVGGLVTSHVHGASIDDPANLTTALAAYSTALGPWAEKLASRMFFEVSANNKRAWLSHSDKIGQGMKDMLERTPMGEIARMLQAQQVELIKSLPIEAGERAQKLAQEAVVGGRRPDEVAEELLRTEDVTAARATLIARTEIAKTNAAITQSRAEYVGADQYIWRTMQDGAVRDAHADLEGKVFAFADPPYIDGEGEHGPGEFPNCRCYSEPILP